MKFSISINKNIINKAAKNGCQKGFEWFEGLTIERLTKAVHKGYCLNAANLMDDYRKDENFIESEIIILDFDSGITIEEAIANPFVARHCFYGYTSCTHTEEHHKFRLLFKLPYNITDGELYKRVQREVGQQIGNFDKIATSCTNLFFGNTNAIDIVNNHAALHIEESLIESVIAQMAIENEERDRKIKESEAIREKRRQWLLSQGVADDTDSLVEIALSYIPQRIEGAGTYGDARDVTWALTAHYGANIAGAMMEKHSPSHGKWNPAKIANQFKAGKIGLGTLFHLAKKHGFKFPRRTKSAPIPPKTTHVKQSPQSPNSPNYATDKEIRDFKALLSLKNTKFDPHKFLPKELADLLIADASRQNIDPVSYMAYLLPTIASLMGKVTLDAGGGLQVPNILWSMVVQKSGGGKSRAKSAVTGILDDWQYQARERYQEELTAYRKKMRSLKGEDDEPEKPIERKYIFQIATIQAIVRRLNEQENNGALWARDELIGLFKGLSQFAKGGDSEALEILLETWDGKAAPVDRVNNEDDSFFVSSSRLSVAGGVQPKMLAKVFDPQDPQGVLARMLPIIPIELPAIRNKSKLELPNHLPKLYQFVKGADWNGITLSTEADELFTDIYHHLSNLKSSVAAVDAWQSKSTGHVARVAFILHAIECGYDRSKNSKQIAKDTLQRAYDYVLLVRNYVLQMCGEMQSDLDAEVSGLLKTILDKASKLGEAVAMRDLYMGNRALPKLAMAEGLSTHDMTLKLCEELASMGYGEIITNAKGKPLFKVVSSFVSTVSSVSSFVSKTLTNYNPLSVSVTGNNNDFVSVLAKNSTSSYEKNINEITPHNNFVTETKKTANNANTANKNSEHLPTQGLETVSRPLTTANNTANTANKTCLQPVSVNFSDLAHNSVVSVTEPPESADYLPTQGLETDSALLTIANNIDQTFDVGSMVKFRKSMGHFSHKETYQIQEMKIDRLTGKSLCVIDGTPVNGEHLFCA